MSFQKHILAAAIAFFVFSGSASAVRVKNMTTGVTLFHDGFEALFSSVSHTTAPDYSADYDPNNDALPGYWTVSEPTTTAVQVTDYSIPGHSTGTNYLRISEEDGWVKANFEPQTTVGDLIHVEWMERLSSNPGSVGAYLTGADGYATNITTYFGIDPLQYYDGSSFQSTGLSVTPDAWQKWEIDYTIGTPIFDLTVNGVTSYGLSTVNGFAGSVDGFRLAQSVAASAPFYVDAVTNPTNTDNRWKYDVDVFYAPQSASMVGYVPYYSPEDNRIWLRGDVCFGEATDAYQAQVAHVILTSDDYGLNWGTFDDTWPGPIQNHVVLPDTSIVETAGGGWERYPKSDIDRLRAEGYSVWDVPDADYCAIHYAYWMRQSADGGQTWQESRIHEQLPFFAHLVPTGETRVLDDGTLVAFAYGNQIRGGDEPTSCYILRSTDSGDTWNMVKMADGHDSPANEVRYDLDFRAGFTEMFPIFLGDGRIFVMMRTELGKPAYMVVSDDYGQTWSNPVETPINAKHPSVTLLENGTIICTYQNRDVAPYGIRARFTTDLGETWSEETIIRDDIPVSNGLAGPYTYELDDGTLFTTFLAQKYVDGIPTGFLGASRWSPYIEDDLLGESVWTDGLIWIPEIEEPPLEPIINIDTRGMSPWYEPPELVGDLDGDGFVNVSDLDIIINHWGQTVDIGEKILGDPSGDGFVGADDLDLVRAHWGEYIAADKVCVPEPRTITMLICGLFCIVTIVLSRHFKIRPYLGNRFVLAQWIGFAGHSMYDFCYAIEVYAATMLISL